MKVLVATQQTQGQQAGDYHWAVDGELVTAVVPECSDAECGCDRGFPGLASAKATTTAMVAELAHMDDASLRVAVTDGLRRQGWLDWLDPDEQAEAVDEQIDAIALVCRHYPAGTVLRRRGSRVWASPLAA